MNLVSQLPLAAATRCVQPIAYNFTQVGTKLQIKLRNSALETLAWNFVPRLGHYTHWTDRMQNAAQTTAPPPTFRERLTLSRKFHRQCRRQVPSALSLQRKKELVLPLGRMAKILIYT